MKTYNKKAGKQMEISKDKNFYKNFFSLFWVIVLQNVIVLGVNLADNIMVGAYNETSLSGVAAVNQVQFIFHQVIMGLGDALVVSGSQYWGQKRTSPIKSLAAGALLLGAVAGVLLFTAAAFFPYQVVGIFTPDKNIVAEGVKYLEIVKYTYLLFAATNILLALLRSVETVKIAFLVSVSTFVINCSINYVLISGRFGAPEMGVRGAAVGTLTARAVELLIVIVYYLFFDKKLVFRVKDVFCADKSLVGDYIKRCGYFVTVAAMFGVSTALQTVILGHMNDSAIAANSVATTLFQVLKVASVGAASATSIIIGKTIGKGDMKKLKSYVGTFQVIFIIIGILTSALLFTLKNPILSCYDLSEETKIMANNFILVLCITCIGTAYEMPVICGIIRGGGDSKFVFVNDLISIWGIVLPVSFAAAFIFELPPHIVVFLLNSDQIFKCAAAAIHANSYKWIKILTR